MASSSNNERQLEVEVVKLVSHGNSNNYSLWKPQMYKFIKDKGYILYIDRFIIHPTQTPRERDVNEMPSRAAEAYYEWDRNNNRVKDWILQTVDNDIRKSVLTLKTAREVWQALEREFDEFDDGRETWHKYLPLHKATIEHDWEKAKTIFDADDNAIKAKFTPHLETVLHIAVTQGESTEAIKFLTKLVERMERSNRFLELLELQDRTGCNPLHDAAATGNTKAAEILLEKHPNLVYRATKDGRYPVHIAATGHRDTLGYLIRRTINPEPYSGESGVKLLITVIDAGIFDVALDLARKYRDLSRLRLSDGRSALKSIAQKDTAFHSGRRFTFLESFLDYQVQKHKSFLMSHDSHRKVLEKLVPCFAEIYRKQKVHEDALELVECLCKNLECLSWVEASKIYMSALLEAADLGIHEVVMAIVSTFPTSVCSADSSTDQNMFHIAVRNRNEKVFNLIHHPSYYKHLFADAADKSGDTILHSVARLAPTHKLDLVSGAAVQMQSEIQWYKEVEKAVPLHARERRNHDDKTPKMVFIEEHTKLKAEGEKWMKDAASSCIIIAVLIATVAFASVVTVPGGIESKTGFPLLYNDIPFKIFAFFDCASLLTSVISISIFLSIMTSRYTEEDFLRRLPNRLIFGLISLFLSIFSLIAAFSAALSLLFGPMRLGSRVAIIAVALFPIILFALLQLPLFVNLNYSTYGRGIFHKQNNKPFR